MFCCFALFLEKLVNFDHICWTDVNNEYGLLLFFLFLFFFSILDRR